jgi:hypothetical protein
VFNAVVSKPQVARSERKFVRWIRLAKTVRSTFFREFWHCALHERGATKQSLRANQTIQLQLCGSCLNGCGSENRSSDQNPAHAVLRADSATDAALIGALTRQTVPVNSFWTNGATARRFRSAAVFRHELMRSNSSTMGNVPSGYECGSTTPSPRLGSHAACRKASGWKEVACSHCGSALTPLRVREDEEQRDMLEDSELDRSALIQAFLRTDIRSIPPAFSHYTFSSNSIQHKRHHGRPRRYCHDESEASDQAV